MACNPYVTIKIIELMLCIACMVYKRVSDDEGRRASIREEKDNREWPLLRFITWEANGSSYGDITYGSYVLITMGLLIGYLSGELTKGRNMEIFFLGFGALLFIAVGSLELAALDSVQYDLIDNAAILGVVSLLTGGLFIIDMLLSGKRRKREMLTLKLKHSGPSKITQTDEKPGYVAVDLLSHKINGLINGSTKSPEQGDKHGKVVGQLKSSLKGRKSDGDSMHVTFPSDILNPSSHDLADQEIRNLHLDNSMRLRGMDSNLPDSQPAKQTKNIPAPAHRDDSEGDDSLTIPSVSFLMRERSQIRPHLHKSPTLRAKMLPMMPIDSPQGSNEHIPEHSKQPSSSGIKPVQKRSDFSQEVVVMSPKEKKDYLAYKKLMSDVAERQSIGPFTEDEKKRFRNVMYGGDIKDTYLTDEIFEDQRVTPTDQNGYANFPAESGKSKQKKRTKGSKADRPKGYVEQPESPLDFSEDLSHMTQSERERYLFGDSPKEKDSTSASPAAQAAATNQLKKQSSVSPEAGHWRFDSRDANLLQSLKKHARDSRDSPSSPMDPGFVLHTAHNWPASTPKTPSQSPTDVASGTSPKTPYRLSSDDSDTNTLHPITGVPSGVPPPPPSRPPPSLPAGSRRSQRSPPSGDDEAASSTGTQTTHLLQKWIKQRHAKVTKMKSDP